MKFTLHTTSGLARRGTLELIHGKIETPVFMPVGTYGSVKAMSPHELNDIGAHLAVSAFFCGNLRVLYLSMHWLRRR